ncbi:Intraflagellar transport protein 57 [Geranomyces michiganensis]|nr:Intraflagellar transport protein 57 [Geranomyces michiganensis]
MDDILDKLKVLNYQRDFCKPMNIKPFHRFYFTVPAANPNEQFYHFTSLFAWLITKNESTFDPPQQFDDPNATVANMAAKLKELDLGGGADNIPLNKLKQGHGDGVLGVLQALVDGAVWKSGVTFQRALHKVDEYAEEAEVDADAEVTAEGVEEEVDDDGGGGVGGGGGDEDAEEVYVGKGAGGDARAKGEDASTATSTNAVGATTATTATAGPTATSMSTASSAAKKMDLTEWRLEVERVTPLLRVQIPNDNKDWRIHVENMRHHQNLISTSLTSTATHLSKLHTEISSQLEQIRSREKYINTQFEAQTDSHRVLKDSASDLKQKHASASASVTELTRALQGISEELDGVKATMDDIGSGMTDSKPLVGIKQGVVKLKAEVKQMDLRVGVIQHTLLHAKLKTKGPAANEAHNMMQMFAMAR